MELTACDHAHAAQVGPFSWLQLHFNVRACALACQPVDRAADLMMSTVCICVLVTTAYPCIGPKWTPSNNNIGSLPRSLCSKHAKHSVSDLFPQILRSNSAAFFGMHRRSTVGDRSTSDLYDNDNTTTDPPCTVDHEQGTATQDSSPGPWRGCKGLLRKPFASWGVQRQGGKITRWAAQHITSPPSSLPSLQLASSGRPPSAGWVWCCAWLAHLSCCCTRQTILVQLLQTMWGQPHSDNRDKHTDPQPSALPSRHTPPKPLKQAGHHPRCCLSPEPSSHKHTGGS